jgi:hypothetical protein
MLLVVCLFVCITRYVSMSYHLIAFILIFIVALIIIGCSLSGVGRAERNPINMFFNNSVIVIHHATTSVYTFKSIH